MTTTPSPTHRIERAAGLIRLHPDSPGGVMSDNTEAYELLRELSVACS